MEQDVLESHVSRKQEADGIAHAGQIEAALALFLRLRAEAPGTPARDLALKAVDTVYCTLLALTNESVSCRLTPSREEELAASVLRRAGLAVAEPGAEAPMDPVERASMHSFPSSDPPGWIWGGADPPGGHYPETPGTGLVR